VAPSTKGASPVNIDPDLAACRPRWQVGVSRERRAVLEGQAVSRSGRRNADLDREERNQVCAPDASARLLFLPLDENLQPIRPMAWKDTLEVPVDGTIRFVVVFDERPGMWLFHCHILDHVDGGLMGYAHLRLPSSE
jgi:hypothetical protein